MSVCVCILLSLHLRTYDISTAVILNEHLRSFFFFPFSFFGLEGSDGYKRSGLR